MAEIIDIKDLIAAKQTYNPTTWYDKVVDPEGDNSHPGTKFTARRGNKLEQSSESAHDRLNQIVDFVEESDRTMKNLRFSFLLLQAAVTSGVVANIGSNNFENLDGIDLIAGAYDPELRKIYIP